MSQELLQRNRVQATVVCASSPKIVVKDPTTGFGFAPSQLMPHLMYVTRSMAFDATEGGLACPGCAQFFQALRGKFIVTLLPITAVGAGIKQFLEGDDAGEGLAACSAFLLAPGPGLRGIRGFATDRNKKYLYTA